MDTTKISNSAKISKSALRFPVAVLGLILGLTPTLVFAHGVIGKRFFPTTLAIEDPFTNDELTFVGGGIRSPGEDGEPSARVTSLEAEYAKTITPNVTVSIGNEYSHADPKNGKSRQGFGDLELGVKYQFYTNTTTESVVSTSMGVALGNTGDTKLEANDFTTVSPAILFGQGFGGLPEAVELFRPLALTGIFDLNLPLDSTSVSDGENVRNPATAGWGVALMYNLHYLQTSVRDVGLTGLFSRLIPIVEVVGETCLNRGCDGDTTGFVNPGVIWIGRKFQLGVEARIPINNRSGHNVGILLQVHLLIDDIFPRTLGRPLFATP